MSAGWNALDYREKAFLIWIAIAVGGGLATTAGRQLVVTMLGILRGRLSLLLLALVLYVAGVVRLFAWLGVWRPSLTDATAFWFAGPALVMFFNSNAATTDVHYFRAVMQGSSGCFSAWSSSSISRCSTSSSSFSSYQC